MSFPQAELKSYLDAAITAARLAAKQLREGSAEIRNERQSSGRDIKLHADVEAESVIMRELSRESKFPIISEEFSGEVNRSTSLGCCWIVDPLDGTYNFARNIPLYCISIGLWNDETPILGVIYDINNDIMYMGGLGLGVFRNGVAVSVANPKSVQGALLYTGLPVAGDYSPKGIAELTAQMQKFKKVRMLGSAALSLSLVASGSGDVYLERGIRIWDVAAGLALIVAAGGVYKLSYYDEHKTICGVIAGQKDTLGSVNWEQLS